MGGVRGPAEMGYARPAQAIVKLGHYDMIAYICREYFLKREGGGVEFADHISIDPSIYEFNSRDPCVKFRQQFVESFL